MSANKITHTTTGKYGDDTYYLNVFINKVKVCYFHWNMQGYNQEFEMLHPDRDNLSMDLGGEMSKTKALKMFKEAYSDGWTIIKPL